MTVNDTDLFLVNRSNSSYNLEAQNLMAELQDTDLMLVNRGGVSYKATGLDIKDSLGPKGFPNKPSILAPANLAGMEISAESDEIVGYDQSTEVLTLSGNKDLSGDPSFTPGDAVVQDSGYTPVTSAITNVTTGIDYVVNPDDIYADNNTVYDESTDKKQFSTTYPLAQGFDGSPNKACAAANGTSWLYWKPAGGKTIQSTIKVDAFYANPAVIRVNGELIADIPGLTKTWDATGTGFWTLTFDAPYELTALAWQGTTATASARFSILTIDGEVATGLPETPTVLTLTDDTNLANFRVGDEVRPSGAILSIRDADIYGIDNGAGGWDTSLTPFQLQNAWIGKPYFNNNVNDAGKSGNNCIYMSGEGNYLEFAYSGASPGETVELVWGSMNNGPTNTEISITGDATNEVFSAINTDKNSLPKFSVNITLTKVSGVFRIIQGKPAGSPSDTNGGFYYIGGLKASAITGINEAGRTMTVNGGTWSNGDVVTGPATTPATGTVGSVDASANTITLSESGDTLPKRWIVNQGKFVKGPLSPSKDAAPEAAGLTLIGSAFASTPAGSLGQTGASWQVAAYDDTTFSAPIAQELDTSTDLNNWEVTPGLAVATQYRCRVRYISEEQTSEWSDASTFKTAVTRQDSGGASFYDENRSTPLTSNDVKNDYGVNPDTEPARALAISIYPLIECKEGYSPTHYTKTDNAYQAQPHEFSNAERNSIYRIQAAGTTLNELAKDYPPPVATPDLVD